MSAVSKILAKGLFNKESIITLLNAEGIDKDILFAKAAEIKQEYVGNQVHLRGLIELTNKCTKNCYYCGIGSSNKKYSAIPYLCLKLKMLLNLHTIVVMDQ